MSKLYRSLLWSGLLVAGVAACGDDVTIPTPDPTINSVSVGPTGVSIQSGTSLQMVASVNADAGVTFTIAWSVTVPATTASISATGLLTTVAGATGPVAVQACATITGGTTSVCGNATVTLTTNVPPAPTVTQVLVTPANANVTKPPLGSVTQQFSAAVIGTNNPSQTVTWSLSTAATPAGSVTINPTTGLVTVLSTTTNVTVNVSACSTVAGFTSVCGFGAINIQTPTPASVSIQGVTWVPAAGAPANCTPTGINSVPVVLTNVSCQIEVTANVNAGDQQLSRLDVLIGGQVVASQTFPGTVAGQGEEANASAPVDIIMSVNTTQVRLATGGTASTCFPNCVPAIYNGNQSIALNLYVAGAGTPLASNAIPVVMNNADAVIYPSSLVADLLTPTFTVGGVTFFTGTQTITGGQYIAFSRQVPLTASFTGSLCGASSSVITGTATTGIQLGGVFACAGVEGVNTVSPVVPAFTYAAAVGPDGTPITPPLFYSTVGTGFAIPINAAGATETHWNLLLQNGAPVPLPVALPAVGVDNAAPVVTIVGTVAYNSNWDQPWINSGGAPSGVVANTYNLLTNVNSTDGGTGVANTTARLYDGDCNQADLPNPSLLAETVTSNATDGYRICGWAVDNIGNAATSIQGVVGDDFSNYFGSDNGIPTARYAGAANGAGVTPALVTAAHATVSTVANTTIFGIAANATFGVVGPFPVADKWGVEGLDTRSGFNQNGTTLGAAGPAIQLFQLMNPANPGAAAPPATAPFGAVCPIASPSLGTILSDTWVRSTTTPAIDGTSLACAVGQPGYFWYTPTVVDRAGNSLALATRNYAIDQYARPNITGLGFATALYTPGAAAPFGFSANDDLEIIDGTLLVTMAIPSGAGTGLRYPLGTLTPLGTRWNTGLNSLTNVVNGAVASIPYFLFRVDETCSAAATPYASCPAPGGPPAYITAPDATVAANYGAGAGKLPTTVGANVGDVAWQTATVPIAAPMLATQFSPNTGIAEQWTTADIVSWDLDLTTTPGTARAIHVASTSIVVPYFENASLWRLYGTEWVNCGTFPAPTLTDNGAHRFWTYTLAVPTTGACSAAGGGLRRAMGTKSGAGLFTPSR